MFNKLDNAFLRQFFILEIHIKHEVKNLIKIKLMLLFAELDKLMQRKIYKQLIILKTKHNLIAFLKQL